MWVLTVTLILFSGGMAQVNTPTIEFESEEQCVSHGDNVVAAFLDMTETLDPKIKSVGSFSCTHRG